MAMADCVFLGSWGEEGINRSWLPLIYEGVFGVPRFASHIVHSFIVCWLFLFARLPLIHIITVFCITRRSLALYFFYLLFAVVSSEQTSNLGHFLLCTSLA